AGAATVEAGPLACPECRAPLARGTLPGTSLELDACASHGTWFDRGELRVVALAYAKLPPPIRFRREDYAPLEQAGSLPGAEPSGDDWFSVSSGALEFTPLGADILDRADDSAYFVKGVTPFTAMWGSGILEVLLAVALAGTVLSAALHV